MLALLEGDIIVMSSTASGREMLRFKVDTSMLDPGDRIIDIQPTYSPKEQFFVMLTEFGKLFLFHYDTIDSGLT